MDRRVLIVDYGIGNIFSVARAIEHCGYEARLGAGAHEVLGASRVVLPGVGAFANGMLGLRERGLVGPLREYAASGRPLLGICLGMQMLLSASEEFGEHEGLALIPGRVRPVAARNTGGAPLKVPHIGWSELEPPPGRDWNGTILAGIAPGASAYFVHSYMAVPDDEAHRLADTRYGDCRIAAAVALGNVSGCQFHLEKSAAVGLAIIRNFLGLL
ncbi:MAG: imidazole glycerol phosphate synthase subunit HisH [Burkholderiales bacterium]|nr:imidazole glycerol phosphate synthase subunit HisH [Burkholderiales bacterium]